MKFFIDTANLEQIREAHKLGVLDGVTTNPSLMARENIRGQEACNRHYVEICRIVGGDVSAEVIATDFEGMLREGEALAALDPHIVVKVPCTADGIRAITRFTDMGIRTNCTLVFSVGQALLAAVNLSGRPAAFPLPEEFAAASPLLATQGAPVPGTLLPWEALLYCKEE